MGQPEEERAALKGWFRDLTGHRPGSTPERPAPPPQPGSVQSLTTEDSSDPGWVFHEAGADGVGFEGWLYHYADGAMSSEDGTVHEYAASGAVLDATPEPEPEAEPEREPEPGSEPSKVPAFIEYTPSDVRSYLLATVCVLAAVASVLTLFVSTREPNAAGFVVAAGLAILALAAWWGLVGWNPTVVSIREGALTVACGARVHTFDLRDPRTHVELGEKPGSPSWRAIFGRPDGLTTVIRAQQVKARHFTEIVEHYRDHPRTPDKAGGND